MSETTRTIWVLDCCSACPRIFAAGKNISFGQTSPNQKTTRNSISPKACFIMSVYVCLPKSSFYCYNMTLSILVPVFSTHMYFLPKCWSNNNQLNCRWPWTSLDHLIVSPHRLSASCVTSATGSAPPRRRSEIVCWALNSFACETWLVKQERQIAA